MGKRSDLFERITALFGREHGVYAWWARVLGLSEDHVSRCLRNKAGRSPPEEWAAIVELLESLPGEEWPARWKR